MNSLINRLVQNSRVPNSTEPCGTFVNREMSMLPCEGIYIGSSVALPGVIERSVLSFLLLHFEISFYVVFIIFRERGSPRCTQ